MTHTPGPWKTQGFENLIVNSPLDNTIVCSPGSDTGTLIEMKSNARLIAAAPDMLDALKTALHYLSDDIPAPALYEIEAAIKKAEGGTA